MAIKRLGKENYQKGLEGTFGKVFAESVTSDVLLHPGNEIEFAGITTEEEL